LSAFASVPQNTWNIVEKSLEDIVIAFPPTREYVLTSHRHLKIMMADKFDPLNSHHAALRYGMERGNGIASIRTSTEAQDAMKQAGFVIEVAEDLAAHHDALPWWYFCAGDTKYA
jgi:hypothetical protein